METLQGKIKKVLKKYDIDTYHWKLEIAKEVATLIEKDYVEKAFVEWALTHRNLYLRLSSDELYEYWQENIKGK